MMARQALVEEGHERLDQCRRKLADHEIYVARFYFQKERYQAAAARAEGLLRDYAGLGLDAAALWIKARSRYALKENVPARHALQRLTTEFPDSSEADGAAKLLNELGTVPAEEPESAPEGSQGS